MTTNYYQFVWPMRCFKFNKQNRTVLKRRIQRIYIVAGWPQSVNDANVNVTVLLRFKFSNDTFMLFSTLISAMNVAWFSMKFVRISRAHQSNLLEKNTIVLRFTIDFIRHSLVLLLKLWALLWVATEISFWSMWIRLSHSVSKYFN